MRKRYNNYDLLRILACIAVIIIHVSAVYKKALTDQETMLTLDTTHPLSTIAWNTISSFAVPCFVMLSGAFLLSNDNNKEYKEFYKKSFKKFGIPIILFSLLFFLYSILRSILSIVIKGNDTKVLLTSIENFIVGKSYYHLWYLYMIVGIYILTPIVIRFKDSISKKSFSIICWIFLILSCISGYTSTHILTWDIGFIVLYLGYFMIGYEIKTKFENNKNAIRGILCIIIGLLIEVAIIPIQYNHIKHGINMEKYSLIGNFSPVIVVSSLLLFTGFTNINIKKDLSKLSGLTFYIYIFHAIILDLLFNVLKSIGVINKNTNSNIVILVGTIIIFIISYLCSIVWTKIWALINKNNRIDAKIDAL